MPHLAAYIQVYHIQIHVYGQNWPHRIARVNLSSSFLSVVSLLERCCIIANVAICCPARAATTMVKHARAKLHVQTVS